MSELLTEIAVLHSPVNCNGQGSVAVLGTEVLNFQVRYTTCLVRRLSLSFEREPL